jgi:hypothetical protein
MVVGHSDEFSRSFSWCETSSENLYPRFTCRPLSSKPPEPIASAHQMGAHLSVIRRAALGPVHAQSVRRCVGRSVVLRSNDAAVRIDFFIRSTKRTARADGSIEGVLARRLHGECNHSAIARFAQSERKRFRLQS